MPSVEISDVVYELLQRLVNRSESFDSVQQLVEYVLIEHLKRHDTIGQLHMPLSSMLLTGADNVASVRETIGSIDWYETQDPIDQALTHLENAELLLRSTAEKLGAEGK